MKTDLMDKPSDRSINKAETICQSNKNVASQGQFNDQECYGKIH